MTFDEFLENREWYFHDTLRKKYDEYGWTPKLVVLMQTFKFSNNSFAKWCEQNCQGRWDSWQGFMQTGWLFEHDQDAVLFKLQFADKLFIERQHATIRFL